MGRLVGDLLALARLDQGRPVERTTVDAASVVRDAAADAGITLTLLPFRSPGSVPLAEARCSRVQTVASNHCDASLDEVVVRHGLTDHHVRDRAPPPLWPPVLHD